MASDQADTRLDASNGKPQNYADALNLLAAHDGVHLNQQFINDMTKLTGGIVQLESQGILPPTAIDNSGAGAGPANDYVRSASVQDGSAAGAGVAGATASDASALGATASDASAQGTTAGDSHSGGPGTWDSFANGAVADVLRGSFDGLRMAGDIALAPVDGIYQGLKGGIGTEINGLKDFAHGDILGGVGDMVAAPFVGTWDAAGGVAHELWDGAKNLWHGTEDDFNAVTHTARGLFDAIRAGGDVALAPLAGAWDSLTGTIGSEVTGVKDLAHGDIVGGVAHIVGAPVVGAIHGVEGVAHKAESAVKNVWHGIENIL